MRRDEKEADEEVLAKAFEKGLRLEGEDRWRGFLIASQRD